MSPLPAWHAVRRPAAVTAVLIGFAGALSGCQGVPAAARFALDLRRPERAAPVAGSRALATALARRMLAGVTLPRGARRVSPHRPLPRALRDPGLWAADKDSADVREVVWLPLSATGTAAYLTAHAPAWAVHPGEGCERGPGTVLVRLVGYARASLPGWTDNARVSITRLAAELNGMHAAGAVPWSCPYYDASYLAVFRDARGGRPAERVSTVGCFAGTVTVGGTAQPTLWDPGDALITALRKAARISLRYH